MTSASPPEIDSPPDDDDLPDWLRGSSKDSKSDRKEERSKSKPEKRERAEASQETKVEEKQKDNIELPSVDNPSQVSVLMGMQFNQQAAVTSLKQQEHELRTATMLARQNEQLGVLLDCQKNKLSEQDMQFNTLIARQMERQTLLETQLKMQQERIDNYIQVIELFSSCFYC